MRGILGIVRQGFIIQQANRQFVIPSRRPSTSWLSSSAASSSGLGGSSKRGDGHQLSGINNNNIKNSKKTVLKSPSPFKRMTDAVRDKAARLTRSSLGGSSGGSGGAGGDRVSSDRVELDRSSKRFTLDLGNNKVARIDYKTIGPKGDKIEMYHSEVPAELRGRGLGKALAKGALELAARENMRVKLTCSYLIDFVNKTNDPKLKKPLV